MRPKIYVGIKKTPDFAREVFRSAHTPTETSHGETYRYAIGPFQTVRGARFMALYREGNPHLSCVADAERIAKRKEGENGNQ